MDVSESSIHRKRTTIVSANIHRYDKHLLLVRKSVTYRHSISEVHLINSFNEFLSSYSYKTNSGNLINMATALELINFQNPVFSAYAFWSTILAIKMLYLSIHTGIFRFKNQVCFEPHQWTECWCPFFLNWNVYTTFIRFLYS